MTTSEAFTPHALPASPATVMSVPGPWGRASGPCDGPAQADSRGRVHVPDPAGRGPRRDRSWPRRVGGLLLGEGRVPRPLVGCRPGGTWHGDRGDDHRGPDEEPVRPGPPPGRRN